MTSTTQTLDEEAVDAAAAYFYAKLDGLRDWKSLGYEEKTIAIGHYLTDAFCMAFHQQNQRLKP